MATQHISSSPSTPIGTHRAPVLALIAGAVLAGSLFVGYQLTSVPAPAATIPAMPSQVDALREFRREEIGAAPIVVDALRDFRRGEIGADVP